MIENSYKTSCGCIHYFVNIIDKQKITLVFLPGLTADHRLFEKQIEYFEKRQNVFVESEFGGDRCFGILADMDFILVCTYEKDGENPELLIYKKR